MDPQTTIPAACQRALSALAARDHRRAELHRKACRSAHMRRRARADHLRKLAARDECRARDLRLEAY